MTGLFLTNSLRYCFIVSVMPLTASLGLLSGCTQPMLPDGPVSVSLLNVSQTQLARQWRKDWPASPDKLPGNGLAGVAGVAGVAGAAVPTDMFMIASAAESGSPQLARFMVRVMLVNSKSEPLRASGSFRVLLLARVEDEFVTVGGWSFSPGQSDQAYRYGVLPGYLFDLRWPRLTGTTIYRLAFRWDSASGEGNFLRTANFEDVLRGTEPIKDNAYAEE